MRSDLRARQQRMAILLLLNLLIAAVAPDLFPLFPGGLANAVLAFLVGAALLALVERRYARYLWYGAIFVLYLVGQIILSSLSVARLVLQPKPKLDPGIVAVPLAIASAVEITALASAITLTPGTISIDLDRDAHGQRVLYVHSLVVKSPDRLRASIKGGFEQMILHISQGAMR